jgi:hypothetical protein
VHFHDQGLFYQAVPTKALGPAAKQRGVKNP